MRLDSIIYKYIHKYFIYGTKIKMVKCFTIFLYAGATVYEDKKSPLKCCSSVSKNTVTPRATVFMLHHFIVKHYYTV